MVKKVFEFIKKIFSYALILPIRFYQKFLSPLKTHATCKFYPTCSSYAVTAIKRFGPVKGSVLAIKRIARCHPWSMGGIDHVPEEYHYFQNIRRKK